MVTQNVNVKGNGKKKIVNQVLVYKVVQLSALKVCNCMKQEEKCIVLSLLGCGSCQLIGS
jgi:hypothetical protein